MENSNLCMQISILTEMKREITLGFIPIQKPVTLITFICAVTHEDNSFFLSGHNN